MNQAVLLTADSDYVPAILAAKEFGVIVKLTYYDKLDIAQKLLDACDECYKFDASYLDDVLRQ
jgi:uncharacterized LabA/DUF88 family protein